MTSALSDYVGKDVVVDTSTSFVYIGRLTDDRGTFYVLEDVDIHDRNESQTSKEVYVMEAKRFGVKKSRTRTMVRSDLVVSVSLLEEVIVY